MHGDDPRRSDQGFPASLPPPGTLCTYASPIAYANQDFDEYQAARSYLGQKYVDWYVGQPKDKRKQYLRAAKRTSDRNTLNAHRAIERWHFADQPGQKRKRGDH